MSWDWDDRTLAALGAYLEARGLADGPPAPKPIGDGHSNLTYVIRVAGGTAVLRRPPPPPIPKGANDVLREARLLSALEGQGVPTPKVLAIAQEGEVLDVPFYIMEHVVGHVITTTLPPVFDAVRDGRTMAFGIAEGLARLHAVDWQACGLGDFGKPEKFNSRHLARLDAFMRMREGPVPEALSDMAAALASDVPEESGAAIVHNDYRIGNVIWAPEAPPRLVAVLDWELATIGDPLLDLGYVACCYPMPGEELTPTQELSLALLQPGFPTRQEVLARYGEVTGRDLSRLNWYAAMQAWKMAVFYEYQHRLARDPYYADTTQVPRFLRAAERFLG